MVSICFIYEAEPEGSDNSWKFSVDQQGERYVCPLSY